MGHVISDLCYKGTILKKNYRKMTSSWSFSYNSFVKFYGKKNWEPQHDRGISKIVSEYDQEIPQSQTADNPMAPRGRATQPNPCYDKVRYKGTALYLSGYP